MNDELSGQLTQDWTMPSYVQSQLWLDTLAETIQPVGEHGLFELSTPAQQVTLRWSKPNGPALVTLPWQADNLEWDGQVMIGGYVDAIHITEFEETGLVVQVVSLGGQPILCTTKPYPGAIDRASFAYKRRDFHDGLVAEVAETNTTWLIDHDSPLADMVHDAMVNNLRLHLWGRLAEEDSGWDSRFALPILLDAITVFAP